jgi:membrane-associated phospholipid phosphatase
MSQASHVTSILPAMHRRGVAMPLPGGITREWSWLLGLVLVDALWCQRLGMRFSHFWPQLLIVAGLAGASIAYRRIRRSPRIADACEVAALWIGFSIAGCVLTYLFATWALPLRDRLFDQMDTGLGFNWLAWRQFVERYPLLHTLLALAYASFMLQLLLAILYFAFSNLQQRNRELFRAAFIALMVTTVISGLAPALTAFALYGMPSEAPWLHDLIALRDGTLSFALPQLQGIIEMPSYHAILAVLLSWSFRRTGWLGVTIGLWNLLMLVSVLSEGGHYLVDLIAGVVVAAVAIWLARATLPPITAPADARRP